MSVKIYVVSRVSKKEFPVIVNMRLLLVTQDFPPNTGGIETYSMELAKRFVNFAEDFAVMAPSHQNASQIDDTLPFPVYRIPVKNSLLPLAAPFPVMYYMLEKRFDTALHAQWQTSGSSIFSKKMGYPKNIYVAAHARELLISPFNGDSGWFSRKLHSRRKKMFAKIDGFFPVSNYTASLLHKEGIPKHKTHVVGNGTDPSVFKPIDTRDLAEELNVQNQKVILSICRLVPRKGLDLVIKAVAELVKKRKDIVYLIGGTGPDEKKLQSLVSEYELENHVRFLGRIPNHKMAAYYSLGDVFVMPARNEPPDVEGFGIVFLEANSCGTPVIGSKTGGIPDAVVHGETGFLIDNNNLEQLINYLEELLNNPELAHNMGAKGRERILEKATWDHVADSILSRMELINEKVSR